ncbi:CHASE2 domain-containing protein [Variovorax sp. dw_308]|uniref:CHASE2 domain-containing protein n=1 Tax=Variovorax sp. dw_308 TaxID=2721546 RepID=UPI001C43BD66|nr:adenylate/guanylate cyclase domain-containing protein [Variovorax sp. dw_308]
MAALLKHWQRILITLVPVALVLTHAVLMPRRPFIDSLDSFVYDWRLRATMPQTLDPRIVIVDIDDASIQAIGQWPWSRNQLARLTHEIVDRQQAAVLGFDVVFAEVDESSGLANLRALSRGPLQHDAALAKELARLEESLDYDGSFARAIQGRPVALGYYFTQGAKPLSKGTLPPPLLALTAFPPHGAYAPEWNGYGGNIDVLAHAASTAGFINADLGSASDGLLRAAPLIARYEGGAAPAGYYESLGLAIFRLASGMQSVTPTFASFPLREDADRPPLQTLMLGDGQKALRVPVDQRARMLIPYRGPGGALGGSFRYVPAMAVLAGELPAAELRGKIVLVGTTAPGLQDLRATPTSATFPGVEVHANVLSALLDRRLLVVPDYALGYEIVVVLVAGLILAVGLSLLRMSRAVGLVLATFAAVVALNAWLFASAGLVLPIASALLMMATAFAVNMGWGYFVEERGRRGLANLFGTYVPPELVEKMLEHPAQYSMRAESKELTVMFCDMRGFTNLSEQLPPQALQEFLNTVFNRLTQVISRYGGTVDKYMGDCVMAFWGAPVEAPNHAALAVQAAVDMAAAIRELSEQNRQAGRAEVSVGIGINTGVMSVGDMGSAVRRSYTVLGDAVNLASRLEGLGATYGATVVASETTMQSAPAYAWQELDRVRVKGRQQAVTIYAPVGRATDLGAEEASQLRLWTRMLAAYQTQQPEEAQTALDALLARDAKKVLYRLYAERLASMKLRPFDPEWDGATRFDSK